MQASPERMKLRGRDDQDLLVLSTLLQDALVPQSQIRYQAGERRFVLLANRFRWESRPEAPPPPLEEGADASFEQDAAALGPQLAKTESETGQVYSRVICGLCFDRVRAVRSRGLGDRDQPLSLLTVTRGLAAWLLSFSGGAEIRLEGPAIVVHMEDLGEAWPTRWRPSHPVPEAED
ncbi:MAG: hypothetical protein Kilf2KO_43190 [Rhodospirillales bacterium]